MTDDTRIVCGSRCTWWDSISKVGHAGRLPVCPHCRCPLFEFRNEAEWWTSVDRYQAAGHPGYRALQEWSRGKCFLTHAALREAYEHHLQSAAFNANPPALGDGT
jgi:hypothetical protein